ncbi:pyridoxal-phosphate dependent enzyme [Methylocystis sp. Sn-Cys]|nr:pyridoxal-phosphate dependent enzyme [Methylocystis sp. Sn-Cys]
MLAMRPVARVELGAFPTPLERGSDLGEVLGVDDLWIKRDDLTGYSWGGNKVRTIEFILGDAIAQESDCMVVCGGPTSNFAALMAAACARHGIAVYQVCYGEVSHREPIALAFSLAAGATVMFTGSANRASMDDAAKQCVNDLRAKGRRPYLVPRGGATVVGALGYAHAAGEFRQQLADVGMRDVTVVIPVGSGGTIAGLVSGFKHDFENENDAGAFNIEVVGVCVSRPPEELSPVINAMATACGGGRSALRSVHCKWRLVDGRGAGFGVCDRHEEMFIDEITRRSRLLVDTTYNGKAMIWLGDSLSRPAGSVVYWHTGGFLAVADRAANRITQPPAKSRDGMT